MEFSNFAPGAKCISWVPPIRDTYFVISLIYRSFLKAYLISKKMMYNGNAQTYLLTFSKAN